MWQQDERSRQIQEREEQHLLDRCDYTGKPADMLPHHSERFEPEDPNVKTLPGSYGGTMDPGLRF